MAERVQSSSLNRVELGSVLPLKTPLAVHIFPSYFCDFKCCYCVHSLSGDKLAEIPLNKEKMDIQTFKNAIDGLASFIAKLKLLNFAGHGEPLLNPHLADMIAYAKEKDVAEKIELVTNSNALTPRTSDLLIAAGLDSIRISIQGLSSEKYKEVSNINLEFNRLVEQIRYFYEHKGQCSVYIKIIDYGLNKKEEEKFYDVFENICDRIAIEKMVPTATGIDYDRLKTEYRETQQGYVYQPIAVCPMPFYMLIVEPNGNVRTCCATKFPILLGNVNDMTLPEIWKSDTLKAFWRMQLEGKRNEHLICKTCTNPDYGVQLGDNIDSFRREILQRVCE